MGEKIVIGPINKGLRNDVTPFVIDNDSFPTLINAYQWRGRVKRKRGTSLLGRLQRYFDSNSNAYNSGSVTITLNGSGVGNILTGFSLQSDGNIVPGTVTITDTINANVYTDPALDGTLSPSGTINYATGVITIVASAGNTVRVVFRYTPDLPVMGLEELKLEPTSFPGTLAFDTTYSYNINIAFPYPIHDVSFYKNPPSATYPGYVQKTVVTPTTWNGQDYQQFWTTNYQGALWATNGVTVPFSITNVGMQFKAVTGFVTVAAGPPATATVTITGHGLVVGDFLYFNEIVGMLNASNVSTINFQTGYVIAVVDANTVTVEFPNATLAGVYSSGGIAQYLTNRSDVTKDCIRWYDGDPTNGSSTSPVLNGNLGWVNFCPPLSKSNFSISDLPAAQYYLVGAKMIMQYKDRLLFIGPVVQTSSAGSQVYLQDTVVYSQNGTPYYTSSFTGDPSAFNTVFHPVLVPVNQTATAPAYWEDQTGFGGFVAAGLDQAINTASANEDVVIMGLDRTQIRFVYTGNDIIPFLFYVINSELGSGSTFSSINMDKGVITTGSRGITITSQSECKRIDLEIPDQIFQFDLTNNGPERVCAQRDFINEWLYITYSSNEVQYSFPNQTLQYNYRDDSWAIFNECYTTYGPFRRQTGFTWNTVGTVYATWSLWNDPWDSGTSTLEQPEVIAGNQHGFVLFRDEGTGEGNSLYIKDIVGSTVTSPENGLNTNDYIIITGALGIVSDEVNGKIFRIAQKTVDTFVLSPPITSGTYLGGGVIRRMYNPFIQTKQFPVAWAISRKVRLGVQQYLLTKTSTGQITLLIFLSQNNASAYNTGTIVPDITFLKNSSLIYSTVLHTCPESTNLGLTPANINLQTPTAAAQQQIWHRINTSLIGDTVQLGFTLSDEQMRHLDVADSTFAITGITQAAQAVLSTTANFTPGLLVKVTGVVGMTQLNGNVYMVIASTGTTVTLEVNSTLFTAYVSGGIVGVVAPNQFSEIELHGITLDVTASQVLV